MRNGKKWGQIKRRKQKIFKKKSIPMKLIKDKTKKNRRRKMTGRTERG